MAMGGFGTDMGSLKGAESGSGSSNNSSKAAAAAAAAATAAAAAIATPALVGRGLINYI